MKFINPVQNSYDDFKTQGRYGRTEFVKISLNDEWQTLVEEHEQINQSHSRANAKQNVFLLCVLSLILLGVLAFIGTHLHTSKNSAPTKSSPAKISAIQV